MINIQRRKGKEPRIHGATYDQQKGDKAKSHIHAVFPSKTLKLSLFILFLHTLSSSWKPFDNVRCNYKELILWETHQHWRPGGFWVPNGWILYFKVIAPRHAQDYVSWVEGDWLYIANEWVVSMQLNVILCHQEFYNWFFTFDVNLILWQGFFFSLYYFIGMLLV